MRLTRRQLAALGVSAGIAGCQTSDTSTASTEQSEETSTEDRSTATDESTQTQTQTPDSDYFEDGALTAPVDNEQVRTRAVSPNVAAGPELLAYDDEGTA